jgi:DNA-binding response OmpR family regulator
MTKPIAFIVEDDSRLNKIAVITLQADFDIESFSDGDAAVARLNQVAPKLVILDLNLPGMQGRDILKQIRSEERLANTRVILTTADERQAETLADEADIVLLKPVSPGQLRELALRIKSS